MREAICTALTFFKVSLATDNFVVYRQTLIASLYGFAGQGKMINTSLSKSFDAALLHNELVAWTKTENTQIPAAKIDLPVENVEEVWLRITNELGLVDLETEDRHSNSCELRKQIEMPI